MHVNSDGPGAGRGSQAEGIHVTQPKDDLLQVYQQASALDPRRPSERASDAVRAHAHRLAASSHQGARQPVAAPGPAANQPRWKVSMLASVLLAALAGLLVLQFDQGTPQEKELVRGQPAPVPSPAVAPATQAAAAPPRTGAPAVAVVSGDLAEGGSAAKAGPPPRSAPATEAPGKTGPSRDLPQPVAPPPSARPPRAVDGQARADAAVPSPDSAAGALQPGLAEPLPAAAAAEPATAAPPPEPTIAGDDAREARRKELREALRPGSPALEPMAPAEPAAQEAPARRMAPLQRLAPVQPLATALLDAARSGRQSELERLIALGAVLDTTDAVGRTPLMLAAIHGHAEVVRRLLAAGADRTLVDHGGSTALQHARRLGRDRITALIDAGP